MADATLRIAPPRHAAAPETAVRVETDKLTAMYGKFTAVKSVSLRFAANRVHALIGPSGCGKSTFLRTLNRMHELVEGGWITGRVLLDGEDIYAPRVNAMQLRRRIGLVFQRPTPFPTMSIYDNVAAGLRVQRRLPRPELDAIVERSLRQAALWDDPIQMPLVAIRKYQVFNRRVRNMYVAFSDFNTGLKTSWVE